MRVDVVVIKQVRLVKDLGLARRRPRLSQPVSLPAQLPDLGICPMHLTSLPILVLLQPTFQAFNALVSALHPLLQQDHRSLHLLHLPLEVIAPAAGLPDPRLFIPLLVLQLVLQQFDRGLERLWALFLVDGPLDLSGGPAGTLGLSSVLRQPRILMPMLGLGVALGDLLGPGILGQ